MQYEDPENVQDIIKQIFTLKTIKEINDLFLSVFPTFIINVLNNYSKDYPHFENNWKGMCLTLNIKPALIILIDDYEENEKHILVKTFLELLTQAGFIVRKNIEFIPCSICNAVLPNENIYNKLKELNIKVPEKWDTKCSTCIL
jgi:hypothetical protein